MTEERMPPDPWTEEGVDLWSLEQAERLAAEDTEGAVADPRWDSLGGPTLDEFDRAAQELDQCDADIVCGKGLTGGLRPWMGIIAVVVAAAMVLVYAFR
jgi:hypothetical protein